MLDLDFTFLWTLINFIVIYIALNFILFKPLGKHMRERSRKIAEDIENAEKAKAESETLRSQYNRQLEEAIEERRKILEEANKKAVRDSEIYINNSKSEAAEILVTSREDAKREYEAMISELKNEIVSLSIAAASAIVNENMDSAKNREIAENFIEKQGVK